MTAYQTNRSTTQTLTGTDADQITLTQRWGAVRITNLHASNWLWVTPNNTVAVAEADGAIPVPPTSSRVIDVAHVPNANTMILGVVGNSNQYTVEGMVGSQAEVLSALADEVAEGLDNATYVGSYPTAERPTPTAALEGHAYWDEDDAELKVCVSSSWTRWEPDMVTGLNAPVILDAAGFVLDTNTSKSVIAGSTIVTMTDTGTSRFYIEGVDNRISEWNTCTFSVLWTNLSAATGNAEIRLGEFRRMLAGDTLTADQTGALTAGAYAVPAQNVLKLDQLAAGIAVPAGLGPARIAITRFGPGAADTLAGSVGVKAIILERDT